MALNYQPSQYGYGQNYQSILLNRLLQLFGQYYKSGDHAKAAAIYNTPFMSSGALKQIANTFFNGDTRGVQDWYNSQAYGNADSQRYNYNAYSGDLVDRNGQVVSTAWNNPFLGNYRPQYNNYGAMQSFNKQAKQAMTGGMPYLPGMNGNTQQGTYMSGTAGGYGVPSQFADMQMLFRDQQGMLHDPGDNPAGTTPGSGTQPPPWWNPFPTGMQPQGFDWQQNGTGRGHRSNPNWNPNGNNTVPPAPVDLFPGNKPTGVDGTRRMPEDGDRFRRAPPGYVAPTDDMGVGSAYRFNRTPNQPRTVTNPPPGTGTRTPGTVTPPPLDNTNPYLTYSQQ